MQVGNIVRGGNARTSFPASYYRLFLLTCGSPIHGKHTFNFMVPPTATKCHDASAPRVATNLADVTTQYHLPFGALISIYMSATELR